MARVAKLRQLRLLGFNSHRLNAIAAEGIDLWGGVRHLLCVLHPASFCKMRGERSINTCCHFIGVTSHHPMVAMGKITRKFTKCTYSWANCTAFVVAPTDHYTVLMSTNEVSGCRDGCGVGRNGCAAIRFSKSLPTIWLTMLTNNINHKHEYLTFVNKPTIWGRFI